MDIAYCMAITLISSNVCLMFTLGILYITSIFFIEGMCVVALALAVMTSSGSIFQPLFIMLSINGLYFFCFPGYSIIRYSIIAIYEFYELYREVLVWLCRWWGLV